jgi:hypothetical protein
MNYTLENVTQTPELWSLTDPVRPELDAEFKTAPGRGVFGLLGDDGEWKAFLCYARTSDVPASVEELSELTTTAGDIVIPYTVWSNERGAGRAIIAMVLQFAKDIDTTIKRVVTLSPLTEMARKFHIRNNATVFKVNETTVNFEYAVINETK